MKKLLALVLCVMLFVSVIPTSAFAATSEGKAVDLYPAVQQMQNLDNAYARFAVMTGLVNGYNGTMELANSGLLGALARAEALEEAGEEFGEAATELLEEVKKLGTGISYERLYMMIFPVIDDVFADTGEGVVDDMAAAIGNMSAGVTAAIENLGAPFA